MQTKTSLGKSLGSLLSSLGGDSDSFSKGQEAGAKSAYYGANAEQSRAAAAKAESERMEIDRRGQFQTPEGMRNIAEISSGTDNDLARMIEQNLRKENVPLDSLPGGGAQDFYPGYKEAKQDERGTIAQLMAGFGLGDKSVDLQKIRQGVTENALSGQLRDPGANVSAIANALSAFKGNAVDTGRGVAIQNVNEKPGIDPLVAALAAMGKGEFNSNGVSEVTGRGGQAFTDEQGNKVRMNNDDNSTSRANNASSNATSRSNNNADNAAAMQRHTTKGAGSKGDNFNDPYKGVRDDIRAQYNLEYPTDMVGKRKGAPSFDQYEKQQLGRFNVSPEDYYNAPKGGDTKPKAAPNARYQEYIDAFKSEKDPARRKRMTEFARSKGIVK